eukprot:jgi/Chlat1/2070/Chrsp17S02533
MWRSAAARRLSSAAAGVSGRSGLGSLLGVVGTSSVRVASTAAASAEAASVASHTLKTAASTSAASGTHLASYWGRCYYELSKARLSALVVATAGTGYVLGSGEVIDWGGFAHACAGTMGAAACANTINQVIEQGKDALMKRTRRRPLPSGRMGTTHALAFAALAGTAGVGLLAWKTNWLAASLATGNIGLYTLVYTPLKAIHYSNTWVGAVVGAIPPLIGWAAASGNLDAGSAILASALYFWQLPHFMALNWLCRVDYAAGGYRMLSLLDTTGRRIAAVAFRNCIYLIPLGFLATYLGVTSEWFAYENALLSGAFALSASAFYQRPTTTAARMMFRGSLLHLPALMACMLVHRKPQFASNTAAQPQTQELLQDNSSTAAAKASQSFAIRDLVEAGPVHAPIAYFSAAPFPFLPVPQFAERV